MPELAWTWWKRAYLPPTRNGTPVIQPTMCQSCYWLTHCGSENNLQVQEMRLSEKADSGYVLNYAAVLMSLVSETYQWQTSAFVRCTGSHSLQWKSSICLNTLPLHIPRYATWTHIFFSVVVRYTRQSRLHFTTGYCITKRRVKTRFPVLAFQYVLNKLFIIKHSMP
jgi:hypothetical protein